MSQDPPEICLSFEPFKFHGALKIDTAKLGICIAHYVKKGGAKYYNFALLFIWYSGEIFSLLPQGKLGLKMSESNTLTWGYYKQYLTCSYRDSRSMSRKSLTGEPKIRQEIILTL